MRRSLIVALGAFAVFLPNAAADQSFHTSHAIVTPIGAAPLHYGFVNDIHTQGVQIAAQERYVLVGAKPNTTYSVALSIYVPGSGSCSGAPLLMFHTATFTTNASGNAEASFRFHAGSTPPPVAAPFPIKWVFSTGGAPVYESECVLVTID